MSSTLLPTRTLRSSRIVRELTWPHGLFAHLAPFDATKNATGDATRIVAVTRETGRMATITFDVPRVWAQPEAGQHVLLGVEIDGRRQTRAFSLSSSAQRSDGRATVTVKLNPTGIVSRHLVTTAAAGDLIHVSTPAGTFTAPASGDLLLVSAGSGITPVLSMLRTIVDEVIAGADVRSVTFLHYTHDRSDVPYLRELQHLAERFRWLDLLLVTTGPAATTEEHGVAGRLDATHLGRVLDGPIHVRACGPAGMVATLEQVLDGDDRVLSFDAEFFQPPAPSGEAGGGTITFAASGVQITDDGRSILDQAEAAGLTPQSGCRMGICHTCVRPRLDGAVRDAISGTCSTDDTETIRICISHAQGDLTVDL